MDRDFLITLYNCTEQYILIYIISDIENGGGGTEPAHEFMVIIPLLAIELKAIANVNPNDDFYWRQESNLTLLILCNVTPPEGLLFFTIYTTGKILSNAGGA